MMKKRVLASSSLTVEVRTSSSTSRACPGTTSEVVTVCYSQGTGSLMIMKLTKRRVSPVRRMCRWKVVLEVVEQAMDNVVVGVVVAVAVVADVHREVSAIGTERRASDLSLLMVATKICLFTSHRCLAATSAEATAPCRLEIA